MNKHQHFVLCENGHEVAQHNELDDFKLKQFGCMQELLVCLDLEQKQDKLNLCRISADEEYPDDFAFKSQELQSSRE